LTTAFSADDRRLTLISVTVVFALSSMSTTVVATAMPRIVAELSGLHLYAWVTTAYMLASTVSVPIWGKLGDIIGRKSVILIGACIFLAGAWLSGLAGEFGRLPLVGGGMTQLIASRTVQGLGGGALFTTALAIVADIYGPRERAKFSGVFGSIFGVFSLIGPVIGGFFTDHGTVTLFGHVIAGWRWVFYVNVPFAIPALCLIFFRMPTLPARGSGKIDYLGAVLMVTAFVPLLLALSWGGHDYAWLSPVIIGLFAFGLAALAVFVLVERAVWDPILPLAMFRNRTFSTANSALFFFGMNFTSLSIFLPLFMQVGLGAAATRSGLTMLPLLVGMVISSNVVGQIVSRTGRLKPYMIGAGALVLLGVLLLCFMGPDTSTLGIAWRLGIIGIGLGPSQNLLQLAIQNSAEAHQMGIATASTQFTRQIGQTVGVALFAAILTTSLAVELGRHSPQPGMARQLDLGDLQRMALERQELAARSRAPLPETRAERAVRESFAVSMRHGLWLNLTVLSLGILLMVLTPTAPLSDRRGILHSAPDAEP
jgi:EmrB/QacA subfamily drug resistance transporter